MSPCKSYAERAGPLCRAAISLKWLCFSPGALFPEAGRTGRFQHNFAHNFSIVNSCNAAAIASFGAEATHLVQVQCLRPFLQPAKYLVEQLGSDGSAMTQPCMRRIIMTHHAFFAALFVQILHSSWRPATAAAAAAALSSVWPAAFVRMNFHLHVPFSHQACCGQQVHHASTSAGAGIEPKMAGFLSETRACHLADGPVPAVLRNAHGAA